MATRTTRGETTPKVAWRVLITDIKANSYNLDLSNPRAGDDLAHQPPQELIGEMIRTERKILELLEELGVDLETEQ